jgi:hypothetical protein
MGLPVRGKNTWSDAKMARKLNKRKVSRLPVVEAHLKQDP